MRHLHENERLSPWEEALIAREQEANERDKKQDQRDYKQDERERDLNAYEKEIEYKFFQCKMTLENKEQAMVGKVKEVFNTLKLQLVNAHRVLDKTQYDIKSEFEFLKSKLSDFLRTVETECDKYDQTLLGLASCRTIEQLENYKGKVKVADAARKRHDLNVSREREEARVKQFEYEKKQRLNPNRIIDRPLGEFFVGWDTSLKQQEENEEKNALKDLKYLLNNPYIPEHLQKEYEKRNRH